MEKLLSFIWPIKKEELGKFLPLAFMLFLTILNYKILKSTKDSLIVPAIGAEAVNFIKFYLVIPSAILFTMLYMRIANLFYFKQIYFGIGLTFTMFFLVFGFVIYPNQEALHPSLEKIQALINTEIILLGFKLHLSHLKWFLLIYSKWSYALFYVLADLWGSIMIFVMFWQFSNQIIPTNQAKRFYPMINLIGSAGTFCAGFFMEFFTNAQAIAGNETNTVFLIKTLISVAAIATLLLLLLFTFMNNVILAKDRYIGELKATKIKEKLSFFKSLKIVFSSKYIGYIVVLVLCYGMAINLLEGPWKAEIKKLYPTTNSYMNFMGTVFKYNGLLAIIFSIIGVTLLKKYSWFVTALVTPVIIFITGIVFYAVLVFSDFSNLFLGTLLNIDILVVTVVLGAVINIFAQSSKFGLFDSTKEMTYIPIGSELKSKGKAVIDVLGSRFAKSLSAFIQSLLFIIFPFATYSTIVPFLMIVFILIAIIWILDIRLLNKAYLKHLNKLENSN
jgi:ATP:ADP antiporter, AAA family